MAYIPDRGDVVWISLDPQAGHEQSGHRLQCWFSPRHHTTVKWGLCYVVP